MKNQLSNLKTILATKSYSKNGPLTAIIGADPAISCTGWALVLHHRDFGYIVTDSGVIQPSGISTSVRLFELFKCFSNVVYDIKLQIRKHNDKNLKSMPSIHLLCGSLEVPAYFGGGKLRITRDMTQREAIAAVRLGFVENDVFITGDDDDKPVRPNQVHSLTGASKQDDKKQIVQDWLHKNTKVLCDFETHDASDAAAIAIVGFKKDLVTIDGE